MAIIQKSFSDLVDFTRGSEATGWVNGQLKTFGINEPRFVTDPATGYSGLLLEPQATNLVINSLRPLEWTWGTAWDVTPIQNIDGTMTAVRGVASRAATTAALFKYNGSGSIVVTQISRPDVGGDATGDNIESLLRNTTQSINTPVGRANVVTGTLSGPCVSLRTLPNGWFETVFVFSEDMWINPPIVGDDLVFFANNPAGSIIGQTREIAGLQIETGTHASSFIPTEDSQVTRAADQFVLPVGDWYRPDQGTLIVTSASLVGETVAQLGSIQIVSDIDEMKTYTVPYSSPNEAESLVLGYGLFSSVSYYPRLLP